MARKRKKSRKGARKSGRLTRKEIKRAGGIKQAWRARKSGKRAKVKSPRRSAKRVSAKRATPRRRKRAASPKRVSRRRGRKSGSRASSRSRSTSRSNTRIEKQLVIKHVPSGGVVVKGRHPRRGKRRKARKGGRRKSYRKGQFKKGGGRRKSSRGAMENPMSGVELFVGSIFGLVGFMAGDAVDRALATHALTVNPTPGANGVVRYIDTPPAVAGDYQGLFNATAICAPMDAKRWIVGVVGAGVPLTIAHFVSAPTGRAALQFFGFSWGVRIVGKGLIDLTAKLLTNNQTGQRLYDGEMRAAALKGNMGATTGPGGDLSSLPSAGLGRPAIGTGNCAPCAEKNGVGYPSMPREVASSPPATQMAPPPPPPPPVASAPPGASNPPTFRAAPPLPTGGLFGVPRNAVKSPFSAWGNSSDDGG